MINQTKCAVEFGDKLRLLRDKYGKTQKDLAVHLEVTQQTVASWESNRTEPNIATITAIADYFDIGVEYFFVESNESAPAPQAPEFYIIQRNAKKMNSAQLQKMYNLLRLSFEEFDWQGKRALKDR